MSVYNGQLKSDDDPTQDPAQAKQKAAYAAVGNDVNVMSGGVDIPMIKILGKAFYWQRLLEDGKYATARDLARAFNLEPGWVAEVLRMTNLAPDIFEAILEGVQPRHLNLQTIRGRHEPLPLEWAEQRKLLGFDE